MFVIDVLIENIRKASRYNRDIQGPYACILWPDKDRQWESAIPRLIKEISEMLILGEYRPENKMGPAIWLRCVIANQVQEIKLDKKNLPIIYLPGVSRQDLRPVENCPDNLKPIAELQYRSVFWSQKNTKDWTILAFLKSDQGGLGLDVAQDNDTKESIRLALRKIS